MIAVGIDVSKGRSTVAVVGEGKKVLHKPFDFFHNKTDLAELVAFVKKFSDARVVMEHTGVYYQVVAETLLNAGVCVSVVNPVLIHEYGNNTLRKVSTDRTASLKIARYALDNSEELRDYSSADSLRDNLKSFVRQFNFEDKTLTAHTNRLYALLERSFPRIDDFFSSPAKPNGHQKLIDFVIKFWHNDCVSGLSLAAFSEKYLKLCRDNRYCFKQSDTAKIHAIARDNITTMPKTNLTKMLISEAAKHVLQISERVEKLRAEMIALAKQLPEFPAVRALYGVGDTIAAQLIGEIGDVRRFESKRSLAAYAGVDPGKDDSGKKVSVSGKISRTGDALLRKAVFQAVECYLLKSPTDEPVYQFLDKKRSEGKKYYVYMTAACNKFLRIYYARVSEYLNALETVETPEISANVSDEATAKIPTKRIVATAFANNTIAFSCKQDRATQECDLSGLQGLAYTNGAVATASCEELLAHAVG